MTEIKLKASDLDPSELSLGELDEIEDITGHPVDTTQENPPAKFLIAMIYVVAKRTNPDITLDDVRDIKFADLAKIKIKAATPDRPTKAAGRKS